MNLLLVTLDQCRADVLGAAGHPLVRTPTLDALCAEGVRFASHYSQAAPCSPGRAALYTGTYQMNNRVVANGTPLPDRFDNVARMLRRHGFDPTLFGYTDIGLDPLAADGPSDPRLDHYDGVLPGMSIGVLLPEDQAPWRRWLEGLGYEVPAHWVDALRGEPARRAEHSHSAFLTDQLLAWLERQEPGWCAHLSYLRPHSPYAAAGEYASLYDPADVDLPIAPADDVHPLHATMLGLPVVAAPADEAGQRALRAQYFGMVTEVDAQLGRALDAIRRRGEWQDTVVVVAADHGEQLCDHGLVEKLGYFEESYHVPCVIRDPRRAHAHGTVVTAFTENVDVLPTICELVGAPIPAQVDGLPLTAFLDGSSPPWWRDAAHWEWDWRYVFIGRDVPAWPIDRRLERQNLAVVRTTTHAYVQFGDGTWRCFDLRADPTWRTETGDPGVVLPLAQALAGWRQEHLDRTYTSMLLSPDRLGRWPEVVGSAPGGAAP
ncbi:MAG TPA: sulfatase-like hydrolase/transferase [Acidimicrobiales bacterium]|nr:sulfatase-like hydrolase/transferase [Acidimicrobiales bacterium]